jgi:hypothetical protein
LSAILEMKCGASPKSLYAFELERHRRSCALEGTQMIRRSSKLVASHAIFLALTLAYLAGSALLVDAGQKKAGSILTADKGKFNILVDGKSLGHEEFEITPGGSGWVAKGSTHLTVEGAPPTTVTGTLVLQPDGDPISYDWTSRADKTNGAHVDFANGVAKMTLQVEGARPFEQQLTFNSPLVLVLDNNLYHQYAILTHVYDWTHRGEQTFSVLIPQQLTPGTIKVDSAGTVTADGKSYEGLTVKTADIELTLYLDSNHRLMRLEVPASKAAVVRE